MARISRFRKKDSERSGFTYKEQQLVLDEGVLVGPDEFDTPPPSKKSLGGEGEVTPGNTRSDYEDYETPDENQIKTQYVTTSGIRFDRKSYESSGETLPAGYFYIVGSNQEVNITANPQVSLGQQNDRLTLECVGSAVILENGSGLNLRTIFRMDSGAILNLFFSATDNLWHETSRSHRTKNLGAY